MFHAMCCGLCLPVQGMYHASRRCSLHGFRYKIIPGGLLRMVVAWRMAKCTIHPRTFIHFVPVAVAVAAVRGCACMLLPMRMAV